MTVLVMIPTHRRPHMLRELIGDIRRETPRGWRIHVAVSEDWTPETQYQDPIRGMAQWWHSDGPWGRRRYQEVINPLWIYASQGRFDRVCQLADDFRLETGFFLQVEDLWQSIDDPYKMCLNPAVDTARVGQMCWSRFLPVRIGRCVLTQWNDMAFWADNRMLAAVDYKLGTLRNRKESGSGAGAQLTKRLIHQGWHLYQVPTTLVHHGNHLSVMNPKFRVNNPLVT